MLEIILTLSIVGFIAGFIYSIPIAGPISIIVVSKAFQGKLRFCERLTFGAAIIETLFVFIAVYGLAALYQYYQPFVPYLLLIGSVFVIFLGFKMRKQKLDLKELESQMIVTDKYENRGGLRTGLVLNLTNPVLFINWIVASFITLSFVSSIGLNTGGLDLMLNETMKSVSEITGAQFEQLENTESVPAKQENTRSSSNVNPFAMSLVFAFGVGFGAYVWLYLLARMIIKYREKINIAALNILILSLGILLIGIGVFLGYKAITSFLA
jgi:threonine/homoserine/homoserine lactone efflux protein